MTNIKGKYKPTETAILSLKGPDGRLEKHFKTTVVKVLRKLKKDMEEVKKTMHKQNGNVSTDIEGLKNKREIWS